MCVMIPPAASEDALLPGDFIADLLLRFSIVLIGNFSNIGSIAQVFIILGFFGLLY